jgi:hypothetical protein
LEEPEKEKYPELKAIFDELKILAKVFSLWLLAIVVAMLTVSLLIL